MFGFSKKAKVSGKLIRGTEKCGIFRDGGKYLFTYKGHVCLTPKKTPAETENGKLAAMMHEHIKAHGDDMRGGSDILSWHYTYQCNFRPMGQKAVVAMLKQCFLGDKPDVTFMLADKIPSLREVFGERGERQRQIAKWLEGCSVRQLTAACCIGNGYRSINVAFLFHHASSGMATIYVDAMKTALSQVLGIPEESIQRDLELFRFYYGLEDPDVASAAKKTSQVPWRDENGKYRCIGDSCPEGLCGSGRCPLDLNTNALRFLDSGEYGKAVEWFDKALAIAPDLLNAWVNRAAAFGNMGNHREAYNSAMKALEIDPGYEAARKIADTAGQHLGRVSAGKPRSLDAGDGAKVANGRKPAGGATVKSPLECGSDLMRRYGEIALRYFQAPEDERDAFADEFSPLAEAGCTEAYNMCGHIFLHDLKDTAFARHCYERSAHANSALGHWQYQMFEDDGNRHAIAAAKQGHTLAMEWISRQFAKEGRPHLALYWHNLATFCGFEREKDNVAELIAAVNEKELSFEDSGFPETGLNEADFCYLQLGKDGWYSAVELSAVAKSGSQLAALHAADVYERKNRHAEANRVLEAAREAIASPLPMILRNLGDNYHRGLGCEENRKLAKELWLSAACREEPACMYTISLMTRESDPELANYWLVGSHLRGFKMAGDMLRGLAGAGSRVG